MGYSDKENIGLAKQKYIKHIKHILMSIVVLICLLIIGIVGKLYMDNKRFNDEMVNIVKSEQAKQIYEDDLKNLDSKALTPDGVIQSYKIDYESIEHSPMGSIMVNLIINNDNKLIAKYDLNKRNGLLKSGGVDLSSKLSKLKKEIPND